MIVDNSILAIGLGIFAFLLTTGICLSAWKKEFGPRQYYCTSCCNPDHWSPEDRQKLTTEQYETIKKNLKRGRTYE